MPLIDIHEENTKKVFGKPYTEVHLWLDEFCLETIHHRKYRHNLRGIEWIRKKWGDEAALVARQHILDDGEIVEINGEKRIPK
jgi:hypothetical protein